MAETKHVLVLAHSYKHHPGYCVAGREIRGDGTRYSIGPWIRPVSARDGGELYEKEMEVAPGRQPAVLDFVEVPLVRNVKDAVQPENWLMAPQATWRRVNELYTLPRWGAICESPANLWLEPGERTDRASCEYVRRNPSGHSLYFIRVPKIRARFDWTQSGAHIRPRRRAIFQHAGVTYEFNITDPMFIERYRADLPKEGEPARFRDIAPANGCFLCVSLAGEFNGFHYKVVATIIEA